MLIYDEAKGEMRTFAIVPPDPKFTASCGPNGLHQFPKSAAWGSTLLPDTRCACGKIRAGDVRKWA